MKKLPLLLLIPTLGLGYTITHTDYTSNSAITAAGQNTNENTIVNLLNGNIDSSNIASGGVGTTQLGANAVTTAKINPGAVTGGSGGSIAASTIGSYNIVNSTITNAQIVSQTIRGTTANSGGSAQEISQGTISTPDLRTNAITLSSATSSGIGARLSTALAHVTMTTVGGPILVVGSISFSCSAGNPSVAADLYDGSTVIAEGECGCASATSNNCAIPLMGISTAGAASNTFTLDWNNSGSTTVVVYNLQAIELRR